MSNRSEQEKSKQQNHANKRRHQDRSDQNVKYEWGKQAKEEKVKKVDAVNMEPSGNLLKDTNMYRGFVIKYTQPPEARKPHKRWRLYPFKGEDALEFYQIHRQSAYLIGRNRLIADIPIDHPSCSLQHAVLQYRSVEYTKADETIGRKIVPYIIDLGSSNGTHLNGKTIEAQRFYELREKDVIKFGFSSREYVLLHEHSDINDVDGDI